MSSLEETLIQTIKHLVIITVLSGELKIPIPKKDIGLEEKQVGEYLKKI